MWSCPYLFLAMHMYLPASVGWRYLMVNMLLDSMHARSMHSEWRTTWTNLTAYLNNYWGFLSSLVLSRTCPFWGSLHAISMSDEPRALHIQEIFFPIISSTTVSNNGKMYGSQSSWNLSRMSVRLMGSVWLSGLHKMSSKSAMIPLLWEPNHFKLQWQWKLFRLRKRALIWGRLSARPLSKAKREFPERSRAVSLQEDSKSFFTLWWCRSKEFTLGSRL